MSTLSELFPAGGGDNAIDMVATGTLPNGSPVILKADGTVEVVSGSSVAESIPAGSEAVFNSANTNYPSVSFDPNTAGRFVVAYKDDGNSNYGTAIVGTVSGTSITFGSEYIFSSAGTYYTSIAFDPNNAGKFVVSYQDSSNSNYCTAIVGTVSGTSISYGSSVVCSSTGSEFVSMAFDPNTSNTFVVSYKSDPAGYYKAVVGTVSGTSITFGSENTLNSASSNYGSMAFDPNTAGRFVVAYQDAGNSNYGTAIVGTVSGTSISYGAEVVFNSGNTYYTSSSFDPSTAGKFVIAWRGTEATAIVGTISGTTITFGTGVIFKSDVSSYPSVAFDPNIANKFVVTYNDAGNLEYGTASVGTISGTSITFGTSVVFNSGTTYWTATSFDPNSAGKFVVTFRDGGNSDYGTAIVGQMGVTTTNLTSTNLLGISQKAVANGETTSVETLGGLSAVHSGLTIGSDYYVATDGSLTTTSTGNVSIGRAVSATTINIRNYV